MDRLNVECSIGFERRFHSLISPDCTVVLARSDTVASGHSCTPDEALAGGRLCTLASELAGIVAVVPAFK